MRAGRGAPSRAHRRGILIGPWRWWVEVVSRARAPRSDAIAQPRRARAGRHRERDKPALRFMLPGWRAWRTSLTALDTIRRQMEGEGLSMTETRERWNLRGVRSYLNQIRPK